MAGYDEWWLINNGGGGGGGDWNSGGYGASAQNAGVPEYGPTQSDPWADGSYDYNSGGPSAPAQSDPWSDGSYDYNYGGAGLPAQPDPWSDGSYDYNYGGNDWNSGGYGASAQNAGVPTQAPVTENQGSWDSGGYGASAQNAGTFAVTTAQNAGGDFGTGGSDTFAKTRGLNPKQPNMLNQARSGNWDSGGYAASAQNAGAPQGNRNLPTNDNPVERNIDRAQTWTRDNYNTARLGLDLTGLLLANNANRSANRMAQQQMQMQQEAQQKNAAMADKSNAQATQSFNEARSLYNPQERAVRAMAQQQMNTARNMVDARNQMARAGKSKATIDAEMRRAKLQGSTGAATAYTAGLDIGRQAQQQALTAAKGLTSNYNTTADYTGADRVAKAGVGQAQQITGMLNNYLGNPVYQQNLAALRRAQQDAYYYP